MALWLCSPGFMDLGCVCRLWRDHSRHQVCSDFWRAFTSLFWKLRPFFSNSCSQKILITQVIKFLGKILVNKSPAHVNSREVTVWWCGLNWQLPQLVGLPRALAGSSGDGVRAAGACGRAARPSAVGGNALKCRCPPPAESLAFCDPCAVINGR